MAIKKAYQDLFDFLSSNKKKTVADVLPTVEQMCSAKGGGAGSSQFIKNDKGEVTHIFCYYHKMWEPVHADGHGDDKHVEYGRKANSATGLNSMCKEGTSQWTKQQRAFKKGKEDILSRVVSGDLKPADIEKETQKLEKERDKIVPRKDGLGSKDKPTK